MPYTVILPRPVQKQLDDLAAKTREQVIARILSLKENPRPIGSVKLKGYPNEYRIRVGDYRIRYQVQDEENLVILLHCKHRKDVYKDRT
jgi:mRNA interferase RelE/StbE